MSDFFEGEFLSLGFPPLESRIKLLSAAYRQTLCDEIILTEQTHRAWYVLISRWIDVMLVYRQLFKKDEPISLSLVDDTYGDLRTCQAMLKSGIGNSNGAVFEAWCCLEKIDQRVQIEGERNLSEQRRGRPLSNVNAPMHIQSLVDRESRELLRALRESSEKSVLNGVRNLSVLSFLTWIAFPSLWNANQHAEVLELVHDSAKFACDGPLRNYANRRFLELGQFTAGWNRHPSLSTPECSDPLAFDDCALEPSATPPCEAESREESRNRNCRTRGDGTESYSFSKKNDSIQEKASESGPLEPGL